MGRYYCYAAGGARANAQMSPHTEARVDLVTLAALLGHSRVQMVMPYAHPTEEHWFNAMKKLEAYRAAKG